MADNLLEDIEDIWKNENDNGENRKKVAAVKIQKKKCCGKKETCCKKKKQEKESESKGEQENQNKEAEEVNPFIPGTQKVFVKTYGCSHNTSDSEYMMGLLAEYGYKIVDEKMEWDLCVINSCTVKNPSQDAFINYVSEAKSNGKKVVVSGCVPQGDRNIKGLEDCSMIGVTQIDRIVEVVEETLKGNKVRLLAKKELPSLDLPKIRRNEMVEIIPINTGCLGSCTYCKTKHARGKLGSYTPEAIVRSAMKACKEGVKEIWITSEDTGAYGRDINTDLPSLIMDILKDLPNDVMIRIGMTNPPYIMEHLDKIVKILNHPNVYAFLHLPVQAGSNSVLDKMNREYKIEDFYYVCDYLLKYVSNITIATDIICGFPTETKDDFDQTLALIEKYKFQVINISQFYPRPGTVAAKWKKVDTKEVKRRSTAVANLFHSYSNYEFLKDTVQRVWIHDNKDENRQSDESYTVGHTKGYVKVLIKRENENLLGKQVICKITDIHKWHVYGTIIDYNPHIVHVNFEDHFKGMYKVKNNIEIEKSNKLTQVKKEQIDIHSTFIMPVIDTSNQKETRIEINEKGRINYQNISFILYLASVLFLILGFVNLRK